jgi:putative endonuclease
MKRYFVYMLASCRNGTLGWDVTSNLVHRTRQHRAGQFPGSNGASMLVWFEEHPDLRSTLRRLRRIGRARYDWKTGLIEQANPHWDDLCDTLLVRSAGAPSLHAAA